MRIREIDYGYHVNFAIGFLRESDGGTYRFSGFGGQVLLILKNLVNPVPDFDKLPRFWTSGSPGGRLL